MSHWWIEVHSITHILYSSDDDLLSSLSLASRGSPILLHTSFVCCVSYDWCWPALLCYDWCKPPIHVIHCLSILEDQKVVGRSLWGITHLLITTPFHYSSPLTTSKGSGMNTFDSRVLTMIMCVGLVLWSGVSMSYVGVLPWDALLLESATLRWCGLLFNLVLSSPTGDLFECDILVILCDNSD